MVKVLFVCLGNICRSPTAQGVFEALVENQDLGHRIHSDSAGTHAYHVGEPPDQRAQSSARRRDVEISHQRARRVQKEDFEEFDYILAMDSENHANLHAMAPDEHTYKIKLFLEYAPELGETDVPDPYYGGPTGFERVLDLVEAASEGLLKEIREKHL